HVLAARMRASAPRTLTPTVTLGARLIAQTPRAPHVTAGRSGRGARPLLRAAKTWAAAAGRNYALPGDSNALAHPVLAHRLILDAEAEFDGATPAEAISHVLGEIAPPTQRAQR